MNQDFKDSVLHSFFDQKRYRTNNYSTQLIVNSEESGKTLATEIQEELSRAIAFKISVAFITQSGINMIKPQLLDLHQRGIKGKLLISPYLGFNDPVAMRELLKFKNVEVRLTPSHLNMHAKVYLFDREDYHSAIVGSSNLTANALKVNYEWNVKLNSLDHGAFVKETHEEFDRLWHLSEPLTETVINNYARLRQTTLVMKPELLEDEVVSFEERIIPNQMQAEALTMIQSLRDDGADKALVISATGTGKTYLSAFDVQQYDPDTFLFVVHREQILNQALKDYQKVIGFQDDAACIYKSGQDISGKQYVFATIQSISRDENLFAIAKDHFDYLLIDEGHRAGAASYEKLLAHFEPDFLLGMTATPERTDDKNIFELFDYNIAYEIRLQQALEEDMLCPFQYFGVSELTLGGELLDDKTNFSQLTSTARVDHIIEKIDYYGVSGEQVRGLMFCSTKREAHELSRLLNERGRLTKALTGEDSQTTREAVIRELEAGHLEYILTVDIFNEGVDIPSVNQVVMLRNTQSSIVFVQQLGRGLRKHPSKEFVTVIDFIGNYSNNYLIPIALFGDQSMNKDNYRNHLINKNQIHGITTINFEEIAEQKIFDSITDTRLASMKVKREAYNDLRNRLGRIPMLKDYLKHHSIEPEVFFDGNFFHYGETIERFESELLLELTDYQQKVLRFVSNELLNGKRPHELLLLKMLIDNDGQIDQYTYKKALTQLGIFFDDALIRSIERVLTYEFYNQRQINNFGKQLLIVDDATYQLHLNMYKHQNEWFDRLIMDVIETGLINIQKYPAGSTAQFLEIGQKYSRKDAGRLLLWDNEESSTMYGYKTKHGTTPIFVTYHKSEEISETTMYGDEFINEQRFHWYTRSQRTLKSKEVARIVNSNHNDLVNHLFVKREDGEGTDFYYLGQVKVDEATVVETSMSSGEKEVPVVTMDFVLEEAVSYSLYHYFVEE